MKKKDKRIASLDMMRIILAVMVIILHFNNSNGGKAFELANANPSVYEFLLGMEALSICAVNCFVMLSGYFLCTNQKRSIKKPILLIGAVVCYNLLFGVIEMIVNQNFFISVLIKKSLPINYFVWLYCTLYLISPYINLCLNQLDEKKYQLLCVILIGLFVIWPTIVGMYTGITGTVIQQISTISSTGHGSGYTIVQFIVTYVLGSYIRKYPIHLNEKECFAIYIMSSLVIYGLCHFSMAALEYCNFFVVTAAFYLTQFFVKKHMKENTWVSKVAGVSFNVFLVHGFLMPLLDLLYIASVVISFVSKIIMKPIVVKVLKLLYWEYTV